MIRHRGYIVVTEEFVQRKVVVMKQQSCQVVAGPSNVISNLCRLRERLSQLTKCRFVHQLARGSLDLPSARSSF